MPIIDSNTGKVSKDYNSKELLEIAKDIRALSITAITAAQKIGYTNGPKRYAITMVSTIISPKNINDRIFAKLILFVCSFFTIYVVKLR